MTVRAEIRGAGLVRSWLAPLGEGTRSLRRLRWGRLGERTLTGGLGLAIAAQVSVVAVLAASHQTWYSFDESNTLRIAGLEPSTAADVLDHDQNFPAYYWILHGISRALGPDPRFAVGFNFLTWVLSIAVFHRIARRFVRGRAWQAFAVLLYSLTPSLFFYAYYVRMYAQANLCFLLWVLFLLRYTEQRRARSLVAAGACLVALALLHPTAGVLAVLAVPLTGALIRGRGPLALAWMASLLTVGTLAAQLARKVDVYRLYVGSGVEYAKESSAIFYDFPWKLLFREYGHHGWALYILGAVLLVAFLRKAPVFRASYFLLLYFNGLFFALHLALRSFSNSHHFYFLTAPFLLALTVGLRCATRGGRRNRFLFPLLLAVVALGSFQFSLHAWRLGGRAERFRTALHTLEPGCILTDFVVHNEVAYATPPGAHRLLILRPRDIVDVTDLPLPDVIQLQVDLGGLATSGISSWLYARRIGTALSEATPPLDEQLEALAGTYRHLYYVLPANRTTLYPEEVQLFRRYRLDAFVKPSIYRFVNERPEDDR